LNPIVIPGTTIRECRASFNYEMYILHLVTMV